MALLVLALLAAMACLLPAAGPASAQAPDEWITSYLVEITIEEAGSILVREIINYDFGPTPKHGIFRDVPVRSRYNGRYDRIHPIEIVSIDGSPGTPVEYKLENKGNDKRIRIGDPDRTITEGHRYTINYRVDGAVTGFPDHDELYWNAVGTEWSVPIAEATVRVYAPAEIDKAACFTGPQGSNLPCATAAHEGRSASFSQSNLESHDGLTVVVGFPKGAVGSTQPILDERWTFARAFEPKPAIVAVSGGLLALVVAAVGWLVWRTGRDRRWAGSPVDVAFGPGPERPDRAGDPGPERPEEQTVGMLERPLTPVEFAPPDGLRPGQVGTLVDEEANVLDVSATIVDLAVRGHLRITEIAKEGWFGKPDWVLTRLPKEDEQLLPYERVLLDGLFEGGHEVKLSQLRNVFAPRLKKVQDALYDDVVTKGWFRTRPDRTRLHWRLLGIAATVLGAAAVVLTAAFTHLGLLPVPLLVGGLLLWALADKMPRRTAAGTGALRRVQGFRRFIVESEAERARFAERKNLFSEYLPYAVVFGCTERWARTFAGLEGELPYPSWYVGSNAYSTVGFAHSLDGFTVSTAGTIASRPSGSGSGFSGGSSGGGGGGGGGGSW
ncbi:MAG: DUF2207 domain-containing protein [Actinomycetota bacterium]|nr:DUF2207 domain-containing protein [Actinomycetota bacterium]